MTDIRHFTAADFDGHPDYRRQLDAGATRPDWCFVAAIGGEPVARVGFLLEDAPPPAPPEMYLFGLTVDWQRPAAVEAARAMLATALPQMAAVGPPIDARTNAEVHPDADHRRRLFEATGFELFQEKQSHLWEAGAGGVASVSSRLTFRSLADIGRDAFVAVLARGPEGTLDRNDRYYFAATGPRGWATVMLGYLGPGDEATWKVAVDAAGEAVGYVMLSAFDEDATGTIAHIGVVPEHRGRGYVDHLLAEATADARARGLRAILSDVDTLNAPMIAAMERAGHRSGVRRWHIWHHRWSLGPAQGA